MNPLSLIIFMLSSLLSVHSLASTSASLDNHEQVNKTPLNLAVASNFKLSMQQIAKKFTAKYGIGVNISSASTATLYQQILRGAPFDLYLSADQKHVNLLIKANKTSQHKKFIYAQGRLVFWKPPRESIQKQMIDHVPTLADLMHYKNRLAIGNPKFAPYGMAAKEVLESMNQWGSHTYIKGNNINQAYQFVASKNVQAGLVSYASVIQKKNVHYVLIPNAWHQPILQSGVVLNNKKAQSTHLFQQFLLSVPIQQYIKSQGYH